MGCSYNLNENALFTYFCNTLISATWLTAFLYVEIMKVL